MASAALWTFAGSVTERATARGFSSITLFDQCAYRNVRPKVELLPAIQRTEIGDESRAQLMVLALHAGDHDPRGACRGPRKFRIKGGNGSAGRGGCEVLIGNGNSIDFP